MNTREIVTWRQLLGLDPRPEGMTDQEWLDLKSKIVADLDLPRPGFFNFGTRSRAFSIINLESDKVIEPKAANKDEGVWYIRPNALLKWQGRYYMKQHELRSRSQHADYTVQMEIKNDIRKVTAYPEMGRVYTLLDSHRLPVHYVEVQIQE